MTLPCVCVNSEEFVLRELGRNEGSLTPGHMVARAKREEVRSFAELGNAPGHGLNRLRAVEEHLCDVVVDVLCDVWGEYIVFEQASKADVGNASGKNAGGAGACALIHLVPRRIEGLGLLDLLPFEFLGRRSMYKVRGYAARGYVWVLDPHARFSWIYVEDFEGVRAWNAPECDVIRSGYVCAKWAERELANTLNVAHEYDSLASNSGAKPVQNPNLIVGV